METIIISDSEKRKILSVRPEFYMNLKDNKGNRRILINSITDYLDIIPALDDNHSYSRVLTEKYMLVFSNLKKLEEVFQNELYIKYKMFEYSAYHTMMISAILLSYKNLIFKIKKELCIKNIMSFNRCVSLSTKEVISILYAFKNKDSRSLYLNNREYSNIIEFYYAVLVFSDTIKYSYNSYHFKDQDLPYVNKLKNFIFKNIEEYCITDNNIEFFIRNLHNINFTSDQKAYIVYKICQFYIENKTIGSSSKNMCKIPYIKKTIEYMKSLKKDHSLEITLKTRTILFS